MLARSFYCLLLGAALLAGARADIGTDGAVTVETNIAHSESATPKKEPRTADRIWSGVIMATNPDTPKPIPKELRECEASLKRMFGYSQFEIVGAATETIDDETEYWLLPVHSFTLEVKAWRVVPKETRGGYLLNIRIYQEKRLLVTAQAKLPPRSPLIVRGPECGKGEIILILQVLH